MNLVSCFGKKAFVLCALFSSWSLLSQGTLGSCEKICQSINYISDLRPTMEALSKQGSSFEKLNGSQLEKLFSLCAFAFSKACFDSSEIEAIFSKNMATPESCKALFSFVRGCSKDNEADYSSKICLWLSSAFPSDAEKKDFLLSFVAAFYPDLSFSVKAKPAQLIYSKNQASAVFMDLAAKDKSWYVENIKSHFDSVIDLINKNEIDTKKITCLSRSGLIEIPDVVKKSLAQLYAATAPNIQNFYLYVGSFQMKFGKRMIGMEADPEDLIAKLENAILTNKRMDESALIKDFIRALNKEREKSKKKNVGEFASKWLADHCGASDDAKASFMVGLVLPFVDEKKA